jgi:hypothetical protein
MFKSILTAAVVATCFVAPASAQSTFTYQGTLNEADAPANGIYDMRFRVWDDLTPGAPDNQIGSIFTNPFVNVTDGLFTIELDLDDAAFQTGAQRYLQIDVRFNGDPTYTTLLPRQHIVFTPRSFYALESGTAQLAQGLDLPITAAGGDADLNPANVLFHIQNFGTTGVAVRADGKTTGVLGLVANFTSVPITPSGVGVLGMSRFFGLYGVTQEGVAVLGESLTGTGSRFITNSSSTTKYGVEAISRNGSTAGFFELNDFTGNGLPALIGTTNSTGSGAIAIEGIIESNNPGPFSTAVRGRNRGTGQLGIGVWGSHGGGGWGIYGQSISGLAGRFDGDVAIIGTLSKSGGSFKIDHPQDPKNMYLSHSFVESPDMKNIYDGVVVLDKFGQALVTLPSYFNALNQDFRYQLTTIGGYAPVYIATEIELSNNAQFTIAGGTPGLKVSWQVTGIRHDAWANQNRIPTEEYKEPQNQGKYLNPEAFGQPRKNGIGYIESPSQN